MRNLFSQTLQSNEQTNKHSRLQTAFSRFILEKIKSPENLWAFWQIFITCLDVKAGNFGCHLLNNSFDYTKKTARK